jgi:hypothetical protein
MAAAERAVAAGAAAQVAAADSGREQVIQAAEQAVTEAAAAHEAAAGTAASEGLAVSQLEAAKASAAQARAAGDVASACWQPQLPRRQQRHPGLRCPRGHSGGSRCRSGRH